MSGAPGDDAPPVSRDDVNYPEVDDGYDTRDADVPGAAVADRPRRRRRRGRGIAVFFLCLLLLLGALGAGAFLYARQQLGPVSQDHSHTAGIVVKDGEPLSAVVDDLAAHGLIHSTRVFSLYARFKGLSSVSAATYMLDSGMSAGTIIAILEQPPAVTLVTVTFPEGLTARQMAELVARSGVGVTSQQYLDQVTSGSFSEPFLAHRPAGASLEGFLFPDTYQVPQGSTAHDLVQMQLDAFASKAEPLLTQIPASQNDYQVVIVASIVEREAKFAEDRGLVAGVIDNRLARGMPLGIDASVTYGLGIAGEPTDAQIAQPGPYNTYQHVGLPPTPISNPGVASITAAARPTITPYVYYVSDGCGHNHYATTAAEHQRNVAQFVGKPCAQ